MSLLDRSKVVYVLGKVVKSRSKSVIFNLGKSLKSYLYTAVLYKVCSVYHRGVQCEFYIKSSVNKEEFNIKCDVIFFFKY